MGNGLTDKQRAFVESYLGCFNATQAAREAKYQGTYDSLRVIGSQNLTKPAIRRAIKERLRGMAMSADEVLTRLAAQARGDIGDFVGPGGIPDLDTAKELGLTPLVKSISWTKNGVRIELYDAQSALVQLGKAHGLFRERHEHTGKDGGPIEFRDIRDMTTDELRDIVSEGEG